MNKLRLAVLIAAFLLLIAPAQATIYVGGEDGVATISEAIEKASENETIIVYEGIYHENVVIDKPLILKASGNVTIEAADDNWKGSIHREPFHLTNKGSIHRELFLI